MRSRHRNIPVFIPHRGCPHTCSFCNQKIISGAVKAPTREELADFLSQASEGLSQEERADCEIAFFGGSFTALDREEMLSYLQTAATFLPQGFRGIRISTRPDAIDEEILDLLVRFGVYAIELGVQSLDDTVLSLNQRGHTREDVLRSAALISSRGCFELGLQMMTGLYGSSPQADLKTAREILSFHPHSVRIYPTLVVRGSHLERLYDTGLYHPPSLEEAVACVAPMLPLFEEAGISVLRVGLHSCELLESELVAGPYHPAFRELCEGELYLKEALRLLQESDEKRARFGVARGCLSKAVGQGRRNLLLLAQNGYDVVFSEMDGLEKYRLMSLSTHKK